jgi:hypothetical protein
LYVSPLILLFFAWFLFASLVLPVFLIVCLVMELDDEDNSEGVLTGQS